MNLSERLRQTIREVPDFPKTGISFKDIVPILQDAHLSEATLDALVKLAEPLRPEVIAGIEARGFLFGFPLAMRLGVPFVPIRKAGKLPPETISQTYQLEYGEDAVEMPLDSVPRGARVLIHEYLLASGGPAAAAAQLIGQRGSVVGFSFLVHLAFLDGYQALSGFTKDIEALVVYE